MSDDAHGTAIDRLTTLGVSTYAARTYVALVQLDGGTARDVSRVGDVPRPRVYDAAEELHERGLVDVAHTSPRRFAPVSSETTGRTFERETRRRTNDLRAALDELGSADTRTEQRGVWTVAGRAAVTDRVIDFFEAAETEIVYMSVEGLLTDRVIEALRAAADRGVGVKLGGVSPAVDATITERIPDAETFESLWVWSDTPAGRLTMIDRERVLVSVVSENGDGRVEREFSIDASDDAGWGSDVDGGEKAPTETAIWGSGETNGLVVVLRGIFTWRLDALETDSADG